MHKIPYYKNIAMSGINTGRAAGKSRGRRREDDVTRSTTQPPSEEESVRTRNQTSDEETPKGKETPEEPSQRGSSRGRPKELSAAFRTTVTLEEAHVDFLDNTAARVKLSGGAKLSRGSILRAVVEALMTSDLDLADAADENDVTRILLRRLRK